MNYYEERRIDKYSRTIGTWITLGGLIGILTVGFGVWGVSVLLAHRFPESVFAPYLRPVGILTMLLIHYLGSEFFCRYWFNSGMPKISIWIWRFLICFWVIELIFQLLLHNCPGVLPDWMIQNVHVSEVRVEVINNTTTN